MSDGLWLVAGVDDAPLSDNKLKVVFDKLKPQTEA
jgi:hypothetical protein